MFYIYIIYNKLNEKLYVGKTNNLHNRWRDHKKVARGGKEKYGRNFRAIHAAIQKYGIDNFIFVDILNFYNEQEVYDAEIFCIDFFNTYDKKFGYNETKGGEGLLSGPNHPSYGTHPTDETRKKLSAARKDKKPTLGIKHSDETKAKWSAQRKGSGNGMYGKHHSDEGKQHISAAKTADPNTSGENHYNTTLTNQQVMEIRDLFAKGNITKAELAKLYYTKWLIIHRIITNQTYKNILPAIKERNV
jgi:group I intron endonuclease